MKENDLVLAELKLFKFSVLMSPLEIAISVLCVVIFTLGFFLIARSVLGKKAHSESRRRGLKSIDRIAINDINGMCLEGLNGNRPRIDV